MVVSIKNARKEQQLTPGQAGAVSAGTGLIGAFGKLDTQLEQQSKLRQMKEANVAAKKMMETQKDVSTLERRNKTRFANLAGRKADELTRQEIFIAKDKSNKDYLNTRQLLDFASTEALDEEEWANIQANADRHLKRRKMIYQAIANRFKVLERRKTDEQGRALKRETLQSIAQAKIAAENKANKAANDAANFRAIIPMIAKIGATAIGTYYGGPVAGAAAGVAAEEATKEVTVEETTEAY